MKSSMKTYSIIPVVTTPIALAGLLLTQVAMADGSVITENIQRIFDPGRLTASLHATEGQTGVEPARNIAAENIAALFDSYRIAERLQLNPAANPASSSTAQDTAMDNIHRLFKAEKI